MGTSKIWVSWGADILVTYKITFLAQAASKFCFPLPVLASALPGGDFWFTLIMRLRAVFVTMGRDKMCRPIYVNAGYRSIALCI